jgi:hypothetical protein
MPNIVSENPNASIAGGTTLLGTLVVYLISLAGVDLSAEAGAAIAGFITVVVLFIGRSGIKGAIKRVWGGEEQPKGGT